jgi:uncharacterized protein YndB with AHSA1/START domain
VAETKKQTPIQQSVHIDCPIDDAFRLFTENFSEWWPLANYSIDGEEAESCQMEPWVGGRVFERTRSGEEHEWGSVTEWDPPRHLELTWRTTQSPDDRETVTVEFDADADGTRLTLIHSGWEQAGVETCSLGASYSEQWLAILTTRFVTFVCEQMLEILA